MFLRIGKLSERNSPSQQRRRKRREAARVEAAAIEAARAEAVAEEASESDPVKAAQAIANKNIDDKAHAATEKVAGAESRAGQAAAAKVTEEVNEGGLFITTVDDELCSDEEYYDEIDPGTAFTCMQCMMEHYPVKYVKGDIVKKYVLCRWHLGVSKCGNCAKNLIGLGTIRVHRQLCRAPP